MKLHKQYFYKWKKWQLILFALFTFWFLGVNCYLAAKDSQTIDEAVHLTAGYSYITTRDFRLNTEHPPLLKELSAMPLLALSLKNVKDLNGWDTNSEWRVGKEFVYSNTVSPRTILFVSRIIPILLALLLGFLIFVLATFFTNHNFGLLAYGLYCLDPNIIAHSHLVTTDIAASLGCLLVLASLFYYVWRPSQKRLILAGVSLGVALSFKFSVIIMLVFVPLLLGFSIFKYQKIKDGFNNKVWLFIKSCALILLLAIFTIFIFYGLKNIRHNIYLQGVNQVILHNQSSAGRRDAYLLGNYSPKGFWYYFEASILIKTPLAILFGIFVSTILGVKILASKIKNRFVLDKKTLFTLCLVFLAIAYLIINMFTQINIGWRHILPIYPVVYILIAVGAYNLISSTKKSRQFYAATLIVLLLPLFVSSIWQFPNYVGYSNELLPVVNQKTNWPRLTDSNLDWGQDLYRLVNYAKANNVKEYDYQLFTNANLERLNFPSNLKLNNKRFDTTKCQTYKNSLIISYQIVYNDYMDATYDCLRGRKPNYVIGSSLLVFEQ